MKKENTAPVPEGEEPETKKRFRWPFGKFTSGLMLVTLVMLGFYLSTGFNEEPKTVPLTEIISAIDEGEVKEATLNDTARIITLELEDGKKITSGYPALYGSTLTDELRDADIEANVPPVSNNFVASLILSLAPIVIIMGGLFWMIKRGGTLGIGRLSKSKRGPVEVPEERFEDVAGINEVVDEFKEVTDFLKDPKRFTDRGARIPRGFLLTGPPGTGKTLLARAVAGEAGVPFFAMSGSDFVETFVGVGASRVRELFEMAKTGDKAIIFIDEIDAIGRARSGGGIGGSDSERENTLNALLTEMDGFSQNSGIIVLAATNRDDVLDAALTRPGRFDRRIVVPAPDLGGREAIFQVHARRANLKLASDVDFAALAKRTPGLTGAEISGLVNEAALESARRGAQEVSRAHFEAALQTTVLGRERKSAIISPRDKKITAWHEAGHTVAALLYPEAERPVTVTIIPRGPAGGVTWMSGSDNQFMTRKQALAKLVVAMAGRAAEEIHLDGDFTQGAQGDLSEATRVARVMIAQYGMGDMLYALDSDTMSHDDVARVNSEVDKLLKNALDEARKLLKSNISLIEAIANKLDEVETLHLEDLVILQEEVK